MNQIIKELADQCGLYIAYDNRAVTDKELESFAELIVRECADIAKHHVMNISAYADAEFVEKQIQTHFGVEE